MDDENRWRVFPRLGGLHYGGCYWDTLATARARPQSSWNRGARPLGDCHAAPRAQQKEGRTRVDEWGARGGSGPDILVRLSLSDRVVWRRIKCGPWMVVGRPCRGANYGTDHRQRRHRRNSRARVLLGEMTQVRLCRGDERDRIFMIVNEAAEAYRETIPPDRWHEPYMPLEE